MSVSPEEAKAIYDLIAGYQAAVAIAIVASIAAVGLAISWFVWEHWFTPAESKFIRAASRKKRPLEAVGGDDGYLDFVDAPFVVAEGVLESSKYGGIKETHIAALPRSRQFASDEIEVATGKDKDKTVAVANWISLLASRRLMLRGAKVPIWITYRGKAILTSLYGLIALQILDGLAEKAKEFGEKFAEAFALIDVTAIKDLFNEQWEESQIHALAYTKERKGEAKARRFGGKESLVLVFVLLIVVLVLAIILIAAAYFLGGGGG